MTHFNSPEARTAHMLGITESRYWGDVAHDEAMGDFFASGIIGSEDSMVEPEDRRFLDPTDFPVSVDID